MRVLLAFAIAPLATGVIFFLVSLFTGKLGEGIWALGLASLIAYPIVFIIGGPLYILFKKLKWVDLPHYLAAGIFLSLIPIFLLVIWPKVSSSQTARYFEIYEANFYQSAIILAATLATVASFWFIARPDRV